MMSRCNRLFVIAIRGFLILVLLSWATAPAKENDNAHQQEADRANYSIQQAGPKLGPIHFYRKEHNETNWTKPNCNNPQNHDEADLCVQLHMLEVSKEAASLNWKQAGLGFITF